MRIKEMRRTQRATKPAGDKAQAQYNRFLERMEARPSRLELVEQWFDSLPDWVAISFLLLSIVTTLSIIGGSI